jgi:hypothetical protein
MPDAISAFLTMKYKPGDPKRIIRDEAIVSMIVQTNLPLCWVDKTSVRAAFEIFDSKYETPTVDRLRNGICFHFRNSY